MKKMTMPLQLKLRQVLWHTFVLFLGIYANPLGAQVTNNLRTGALVERFDYAKVQDNSLTQLSDAAAQLAQTLDSAFQIQDFKVFDFGLYLPTLRMSGELSFDQAVSNMYERIETGGIVAFRNPTMPILRRAAPPAAYVFITHQFQGGGNVRFSMIVKIPGMSQTGADVSGVEKALALAGQSAMEAAYQKNSHEDNVAAAKAEGLRAIKRFLSGKGDPVETAGGGFVLKHAMNFVALSGKIIQLPPGATVKIYCVAPQLTNGYLIGFEIGDKEYVAGGSEFSISQPNFSGYKLRNNPGVIYQNTASLTPGKLPITFFYEEKSTVAGSRLLKIFSQEHSISADRIESTGGTFSGPRLPGLSYDISRQPLETADFPTACGKHKDIIQMADRMGGDIEIVIQKGKSDQSPKYFLDKDGNASIPVTPNDPLKAKGRITFTEQDGKITDAEAKLNPNAIKPGRNDYKSTEGGNSDPLKASEDVINAAINDAFAKAGSSGIHTGWNDAAVGTMGRFHCETMPVTGIALVIIEVGISIYESAALPEQVWNEPPGTTAEKGSYPIHGPPVVCGVADGVIEEVTEIPQLVKMGVDLASSPENVKALVASIADITPAKIVELAEGEIKKKWENYTGPPQVMFHTGGKDAVAVATVLLGVGTILEAGSKFKDAIQETGEAISRGLDNLLTALRNKLNNKTLFSTLKNDIGNSLLKKLFTEKPDLVKIWELLQTKGKKNAKLKPEVLQKLELLPEHLRDLVTEFSDDASGSTLSKFCEALDDQSFLDYVKSPDNDVVVRGFLAHKEGIISEEEARLLSEMLEKDEITHPKALEWMQRSKSYQKFKGYSEAGKAFEKAMTEALKDIGSAAYQALKNKVDDLDSRAILSQVQFCIKGDCINKGEYFVADLVLVSKKTDPFGAEYIEDIIVIDTKLSKSTDFTPNQKVANGLSNLEVKSISGGLVKGSLPNNNTFKAGAKVPKKGQIRKMYTNEAGEVFVD